MVVVTGCEAPEINTLKPASIIVEVVTISSNETTFQTVESFNGFPGHFKSLKYQNVMVPMTLKDSKVQFKISVTNVSEIKELILIYELGGERYNMLFNSQELIFRAL